MNKLIISFIVAFVFVTLSACATVKEARPPKHGAITKPEETAADHRDNGPFSTDPHSVFTN
jgi:uncharacterized protein YceK